MGHQASRQERSVAEPGCEGNKPVVLQGWVFNVVPWLVTIPSSVFGGWIADKLVSSGETFSSFPPMFPICFPANFKIV